MSSCIIQPASLVSSVSSSSSSSSSSAPIIEHSRLYKLTPLWTILRTQPRCVETKVMGPTVELYCTEPCLPWSTCPAPPIRWRTIDGCSKNVRVFLWWVSCRKVSEQMKSSFGDNWRDWGSTCSMPHFFVGDMRRIWNMYYIGMCGKPKFCSDSVFKNRTVSEPSKNLTSVQTVFRQKLRANSQFMLKVTKSYFTCIQMCT